jgi:23S rRNA (guanosine2251-2'-O)-methyltransferase
MPKNTKLWDAGRPIFAVLFSTIDQQMKKLTMDEMNRLSTEDFRLAAKMDVIVVLDDVRSMMNIGSVFRTCDAFRVKKICLCGITATPPHREMQKTALGATESVVWEYHASCPDLLRMLKDDGAFIVAIEQVEGSVMLDEWKMDVDQPLVLLFGNEVHGVSEEALAQCHLAVEIPQHGTKHSLNIAVSAGIVIWEVFRHKKKSVLD